MPAEASAHVLPNGADNSEPAHLLREVRRAVQLVHQGRAGLLFQVRLASRQVLPVHPAPDRRDLGLPRLRRLSQDEAC